MKQHSCRRPELELVTGNSVGRCLLSLFLLAGLNCATSEIRIDGTFEHRETGGYIVFAPDGSFYYSLDVSAPESGERPQNLGYYRFRDYAQREPDLTLRAAHAGLFKIVFSEDRTQLTVYFLLQQKPPRIYVLQQH